MADNDQQLLESDVAIQTEAARENFAGRELAEIEAVEATEAAEIGEAEEFEYANELAAEQEANQILQQAEGIREQGKRYSHPSYFKYFVILIPWAIVVDIIDTLTLTGVGYIIAVGFSLFSTALIMFILWFLMISGFGCLPSNCPMCD